ncbi:MAG TPA: hypothetical protein PLQ49_00325 [Methanothrix sp.]|nr:hypothetical protein [Methanothrix sp.]HRW82974.1 hypothetical protein [Methanothrix sp.]
MAITLPAEKPAIAEGREAVEELPAVEMAYLTVSGPYTSLEDACNKLFGWRFQKGEGVSAHVRRS